MTYGRVGVGRVVLGLVTRPWKRPTLCHAGRGGHLDTWRGQQVTLARLEPGRELGEAHFLEEEAAPRAIADAPISAAEIRRLDADLPAVVDAWVPTHAPASSAGPG